MRLSVCVLLVPIALSLAIATTARANWTPDGVTLFTESHGISYAHLATNGTGEVFGWANCYGGGAGYILRARRVEPDGSVPANWEMANPPQYATCGIPDGTGGFFHVSTIPNGSFSDVYVWRVQSAGGLAPGWTSSGLLVTGTNAHEMYGMAVPDGVGNAIVAYDEYPTRVRAKRVLANGTIDAGWPAAGVSLSDPIYGYIVSDNLLAIADGAGGACVVWESDVPRVQRVTQSGSLATDWPAEGVMLSGSTPSSTHLLGIVPSGPTHFIVGWMDGSNVVLQRSGLDATIDGNWPGDGIAITAGTAPVLIADGSDGAMVAWHDGSYIMATHVHPDGTFADGWPASGLSLLGPNNYALGSSYTAVTTGPGGGFVVCWDDARRPGHTLVRARWLLANGDGDPTMPDSGVVVSPAASTGGAFSAISDGNGGVYVAWENDNGNGTYDLRVTWLPYPSGTVGVPPPARGRELALTTFPNPARGRMEVRFTLASPAGARLELLDLAGRRVASREVTGVGEHVEPFEQLGGLVPGVYLVRLAQGATVRVARAVVMR